MENADTSHCYVEESPSPKENDKNLHTQEMTQDTNINVGTSLVKKEKIYTSI